MTLSPETAKARAEAVSIAKSVLAGALSPILGARRILGLRWKLGLPENDADIRCFQGLDSETDALPVGPEREQWAEAALQRKQDEIRRADTWAREFGADSFRSLVKRWERP